MTTVIVVDLLPNDASDLLPILAGLDNLIDFLYDLIGVSEGGHLSGA